MPAAAERRACPNRGLVAQGTVTVLTAHRPDVGHSPMPIEEPRDHHQHAPADLARTAGRTAGRGRAPGGGHPQGRACRRRSHRARGAPGSPGVPRHRRRIPPTPGLGTLFRRPAPSRSGVHRILRIGPGTPPAPGEHPGRRGQPARPRHAPHARQDRRRGRGGCRPRGAVRTR